MRLSLFNKFDTLNDTSFQPITVQFTGPLILHADPNEPLHIATKRYVDNKLGTGLNANNITSGIIPGARLPAFTGDVTSSIGSTVFTLTNSGVTAGNYTKFTVDTKGRITSGSTLTQADIPNLSWSKVNVGRPTTLAGYGITDAVKATGDSLVGTLTITGNPSLALHAVNKQYVDVRSLGLNSNEPTGTIIRRTSSVVPSGYLRCNGGSISKTTYSALYAVIGDQYGNTHQPGSGTPWKQQYLINNIQSSQLGSWVVDHTLPIPLYNSQIVVTENRVFILGGHTTGPSISTAVYTASINPDGSLGAWTATTPLPVTVGLFTPVVVLDRLYILGGSGTVGYTGETSGDIYYANITTEGTLGNWTKHTVALPKTAHQIGVFLTRNRIYCVGGFNSPEGILNTVYTATINSSGSIGSFSSAANLPETIDRPEFAIIKDYVYMIGGGVGIFDGTEKIYRATIATDGTIGGWTQVGVIPNNLVAHKLITTKHRLYVIGGTNLTLGQNGSRKVYSCPINSDGTLGTWATDADFPITVFNHEIFATTTRLYSVGGNTTSGAIIDKVYVTPFAGGLNSYSAYYDGSILSLSNTTHFRLPNYTDSENAIAHYFIKYT